MLARVGARALDRSARPGARDGRGDRRRRRTTGARPLVSDWNAVSPATARELERILAGSGLELVDGSISGGPPRADYTTRVYLSGPGAEALAAFAPAWIDARVVGAEVGLASAVKMCTASMYKGSTALLAHALLTAHAHGVLPQVLDDLHDSFPAQIDRAARSIAVSTTKAGRFVGEMREIAATQAGAGLTPALFEAMAEVYAALSRERRSPPRRRRTSRARHSSKTCSDASSRSRGVTGSKLSSGCSSNR